MAQQQDLGHLGHVATDQKGKRVGEPSSNQVDERQAIPGNEDLHLGPRLGELTGQRTREYSYHRLRRVISW
jgi:hypothetical protein